MKTYIRLFATLLVVHYSQALSAQANINLSNLGTTSVNQHLQPQGNNTRTLGTATKSWKDLFIDGGLYLDDQLFISNSNILNCAFIGNGSGAINLAGNNTGVGYRTLFVNTTGTDNTAIGFESLYNNTIGSYNSGLGRLSLFSNINGNYNTAVGVNAMYANTSGHSNTAAGYQSLHYNTSGTTNTAVGLQALFSNTIANNNSSIGHKSMFSNTTGQQNTALGAEALFANTTGNSNVAIGFQSLLNNTSGFFNISIGEFALVNNLNGFNNVAIGSSCMIGNTAGYQNVAIGSNTLISNTTGLSNTAIGFSALGDNTTGNGNVAIGLGTLDSNTIGHSNVAIGNAALLSNNTGIGNIGLGVLANVAYNNLVNATVIGWLASVDGSDKIRLGNSSISTIGGQVNWTVWSDKRVKNDIKENVPGLEFINQLRPVTYHYDVEKENKLMGISDTINWESKYDIEKISFTGFIAQEVDAAAENIGYQFSGVDKTGKIMGLRYAEFVVPLVKAVQQLDSVNKAQNTAINELENQNALILNRLAQLEQLIGLNSNQSTLNKVEMAELKQPTLFQNYPNPFANKTTIGYFIPESTAQAKLVIQDVRGVEITSVDLKPGEGTVDIDAGDLTPGNYLYALYVNNQIVTTKYMVLTK